MKRHNTLIALVMTMLFMVSLLSACAVSTVARKSVESSSKEFTNWAALFKMRINQTEDQDIAPFVIWIVQIIGEDKARLPREGERLIDKVQAVVSKPDGYKYSVRERAELMGAWDRLFIILYEETGKAGQEILQRLMTAGVL